jgi:DNA-binding MarR family transcriptional regulator
MYNLSMATAQDTNGAMPTDTDAFLSSFDAFAQAVRRARGARGGADTGALTLSQYGLLEPLHTEPTARVSELAEQAGVSAPTATRILDTLERRGFVERGPAPDDRRGVRVTLTDLGRTTLAAQCDWVRTRQRVLFDSLPPADQAVAPDLLLRLAALIDELAAGPGA